MVAQRTADGVAQRLVGWTGRLFPSADGARLVFRGEGVVLVR